MLFSASLALFRIVPLGLCVELLGQTKSLPKKLQSKLIFNHWYWDGDTLQEALKYLVCQWAANMTVHRYQPILEKWFIWHTCIGSY